MTQTELEQLGVNIALKIAAGIAKGAAAGADIFAMQMDATARKVKDAREAAELEAMEQEAERIDAERAALASQLADATGLKAAALKRRLARLDVLEAEMVALADGEPARAGGAAKGGVELVPVKRSKRGQFEALNGTH